MTLIPKGKLEMWERRAWVADSNILQNLIDFREFYEELKSEHGTSMQAYAEAAQGVREIESLCRPDAGGGSLLRQAIGRLNLSARAYHRVLKVARSIADLAGSDGIAAAHVAEAIQYRRLDRA